MDKVFEQILKYLPADIVPAIIALTVAFLGTYYFKGIRSYTDALHDRVFLTLAVLIAGAFLVLQIQKSDAPRTPSPNARPLLLVPRFENDVGRELEALFVTQLRATVERYIKDASIEQINTYVRDVDTARLNAGDSKPFAVLFQPKIIREGENKPVLCFRLLFLESGRVTTFAAVPAELEKMNLGDLSNALLGGAPHIGSSPGDPILSRLDALERRVAELSNTVLKTTVSRPPTVREDYGVKRAIVIGVNYDRQHRMPLLAFAASDAEAMANTLTTYGFETTLLVNEEATRHQIQDAIDNATKKSKKNDLLLVFYGGASVRSSDFGGLQAERLILPTYDLQLSHPLENLTLNDIVDRMRPAAMQHRLIVLDGCHGTYGLTNLPAGGPADPNDNGFQIIAASQDDQFAFELPDVGGGIFTQKIIARLKALTDSGTGISTRELITDVAPDIARLSGGKQSPKLVTLAGSRDILFQRDH